MDFNLVAEKVFSKILHNFDYVYDLTIYQIVTD